MITSPPAIEIQIRIEERPKVYLLAMYEDDQHRIEDWVAGNPALQKLVDDALALGEAA